MQTGKEMLPPGLKPALIVDVVRGAEAALFRVTARHGALLSAFMMLDFGSALIRSWAPFRETVKL